MTGAVILQPGGGGGTGRSPGGDLLGDLRPSELVL